MTVIRGAGEEWKHPPVVEAMYTNGLHPIGYYIRRRQATIPEKVACRPIYELYVVADWIKRTIRMVIWWDQDVVNEPEE